MVVRFLPQSGASSSVPKRDHGALAEVIDLRTRLPRVLEEEQVRPAVDAAQNSSDEGRAHREGKSSASEDGVRLLARKARSSGELRRELRALGHDSNEVDATLLEFESSLYLDDIGLARGVAEGLRSRKRASKSQIRVKLRERLLPEAVIDLAISELSDDDERELLRSAAEDRAKRLSGLDRVTAERRLIAFLARRGWSGERATRVARESLDRFAARDPARGSVRFQ